MEKREADDVLHTKLLHNQPYDESLEIDDAEEVASIHTATPRRRPTSSTHPAGRARNMADPQSSEEEEKPKQLHGGFHHECSDEEDMDDTGDDEEDEDDDDEDEDEEEENGYDPADFAPLAVSPDIRELFQYITRYTPHAIDLGHRLKPFIPDYIPSVGDIDAFLKVPRPDNKPDHLGLLSLDEPSTKQSDPTVLALWLNESSKQHSVSKQLKVKSLDNAQKNQKAIESWISSITELHSLKPPANVHYIRPMPEVENLMQEWPRNFEELLGKQVGLPTAAVDCDLPVYTDMICGILDIPVYKSRIQSLHVLFSLYSEFKNSQHFKALAEENKEKLMFDKAASSNRDAEFTN